MSASRSRIAVDLGTTTIAVALLDENGIISASKSFLNPQRKFGLDVIKRLEYSKKETGGKELQQSVSDGLDSAVSTVLLSLPQDADLSLYVAGNTVMQTLLLGMGTEKLSRPPFRPDETGSVSTTSVSIGFSRDFPVYIFPQPSGFIGGDTVAFLFAEKKRVETGFRLFVDIGTNAEIALSKNGSIIATSAAAGPAFEAGNLSCGMIYSKGAVTSASIKSGRFDVSIAESGVPSGICGSGAVSLLSLLLKENVIDRSGRVLPPEEISSILGTRVIADQQSCAFTIFRDSKSHLKLTQQDIREIQLASAAVRAGIDVLLERSGLLEEDVEEVVITGSFGAHLSPSDLAVLGILSHEWVTRTSFVPAGALKGVIAASSSVSSLAEMEAMASEIRVIPLSGTPNFEKYFIERMTFPAILA